MDIPYKKIRKKLKKTLSQSRYEHTLGVAYTAAALAMRYKEEVDSAFLAGLLHDCAKHLSDAELIEECRTYDISISKTEETSPYLLHGKVGSLYARKLYHINDSRILNAISYHTTGRANMDLLEKILFTADYIEPNRTKVEELPQIRELAFDNLDAAVYQILKNTIAYLTTKKAVIDETSKEAYEFYRKHFFNEK